MENGVPQGSPLSVVLFSIAFNQISQIIKSHNFVDHCLYADDLYILGKRSNAAESKELFENILRSISDWAEYSGVKISLEKLKIFMSVENENVIFTIIRYLSIISKSKMLKN